MSVNSDNPISLAPNLIKSASLVLADAFEDDPTSVLAYPGENDRKRNLKYVYEFLLRYSLRNDIVRTTSGNAEGIIVWQRPSCEPSKVSYGRILLSGAVLPAFKLIRIARTMKPLFESIDGIRKELMPRSHWYLALLGVAPTHQGKGLAGKLIREMLPRIDEERLPCYLETATETTVAIYRHFGFEVVREFNAAGTGVKFWAMEREAR